MNKTRTPISQQIEAFQPLQNDVWGNEFNPSYRFIFENQTYNEKECKLLVEFKTSEFYSTLDQSYWNDAQLLRWIQGSNYDLKVAQNNIQLHDQWRAVVMPNINLIETVKDYLVG